MELFDEKEKSEKYKARHIYKQDEPWLLENPLENVKTASSFISKRQTNMDSKKKLFRIFRLLRFPTGICPAFLLQMIPSICFQSQSIACKQSPNPTDSIVGNSQPRDARNTKFPIREKKRRAKDLSLGISLGPLRSCPLEGMTRRTHWSLIASEQIRRGFIPS